MHLQNSPLSFLIGKWHTTGKIVDAASPSVPIEGIDVYEWALDGFFILHRVDVMMGDEKTEAIELIGGYGSVNNAWLLRSFDNQGSSTIMQATLTASNILQISGPEMRSELLVSKDGNHMTAHWEKSDDGKNWVPWMDMNFARRPDF